MANIFKEQPATQLALFEFEERVAVPDWGDLAEHTQTDAIRILIQLLISVQENNPCHHPQNRGERE